MKFEEEFVIWTRGNKHLKEREQRAQWHSV